MSPIKKTLNTPDKPSIKKTIGDDSKKILAPFIKLNTHILFFQKKLSVITDAIQILIRFERFEKSLKNDINVKKIIKIRFILLTKGIKNIIKYIGDIDLVKSIDKGGSKKKIKIDKTTP
ncbi:hypothetical protein DMB68_00460 [Flavobacterium hydrophilum]|uniref:Uncharacterized protein n=1 Tax=Flavobacterium hydrophilum TaxID=2211445 RepID=A0A2V4C308_9FLAO|nr:hypothetical protein DMB68_00460 [Flavobacterium hydrophilum]